MSQYLLDCDTHAVCTMVPYTSPPATVDHYAIGPWWVTIVVAVVILAVIVGVAVVRYKAHEEHASVDRTRILNPPKHCPTCGDRVEAEAT